MDRRESGMAKGLMSAYPIANSFAVTVLLALFILALLRHLFGSVRLEVGTR